MSRRGAPTRALFPKRKLRMITCRGRMGPESNINNPHTTAHSAGCEGESIFLFPCCLASGLLAVQRSSGRAAICRQNKKKHKSWTKSSTSRAHQLPSSAPTPGLSTGSCDSWGHPGARPGEPTRLSVCDPTAESRQT